MKIIWMNDWKKNPFGNAKSLILVGYLDIQGMPTQVNIVLLGFGISIQWRKKREGRSIQSSQNDASVSNDNTNKTGEGLEQARDADNAGASK